MGKFIDLKNKQIGQYKILEQTDNSNNGKIRWIAECVECGNKIIGETYDFLSGNIKSCDCSKKHISNIHPRQCKHCGFIFDGGPRAWYCPKCRAERKKQHKKEYQERKSKGSSRKIGNQYVCEICGNKYILKSGKQKYCESCAKEQMILIDRKQGLEYYRHNKNEINQKRYERRKKEYQKNIKTLTGGNNEKDN